MAQTELKLVDLKNLLVRNERTPPEAHAFILELDDHTLQDIGLNRLVALHS